MSNEENETVPNPTPKGFDIGLLLTKKNIVDMFKFIAEKVDGIVCPTEYYIEPNIDKNGKLTVIVYLSEYGDKHIVQELYIFEINGTNVKLVYTKE